MGVAEEVQQSLLPDANPALPGFDIAGTSLYCEETGRDYYDFIDIDDKKLAVVVGDVSGHGISSALLMATARALVIRLRASLPGPNASIINDVNRCLNLDEDMMIALIRTVRCIQKNKSIRCVILKGNGPSFCAGLDLRYVAKHPLIFPKYFSKLSTWLVYRNDKIEGASFAFTCAFGPDFATVKINKPLCQRQS
ncbi:MAG: SpoIIE family protein phosphatase [Desulfobulbaceae bacterium]|nr:SpoIIE family protein phosphatase [Desulfobulbaceae bacterium]